MGTIEPSKSAQPAHGATPATPDAHVTVTPLKPGKLLRLPAVMELCSLGRSSVYAGVRAKTFPAPVRLSARAVAWREESISSWVSSRIQTGEQS